MRSTTKRAQVAERGTGIGLICVQQFLVSGFFVGDLLDVGCVNELRLPTFVFKTLRFNVLYAVYAEKRRGKVSNNSGFQFGDRD
ncbi:hypothetical protein Poly59_08830 [Rubripirellula reticaptiva]|uniref:Uncharacterized protein n=1 Tax=Rubripirellula reticaptiva TaxID=2528013 RepID=A0A5C6FCE2_9BACT|nr:hypothetical protein Poly59_08830 [Rubripirellula reticaptiva]